jgi:hypothetical protein
MINDEIVVLIVGISCCPSYIGRGGFCDETFGIGADGVSISVVWVE